MRDGGGLMNFSRTLLSGWSVIVKDDSSVLTCGGSVSEPCSSLYLVYSGPPLAKFKLKLKLKLKPKHRPTAYRLERRNANPAQHRQIKGKGKRTHARTKSSIGRSPYWYSATNPRLGPASGQGSPNVS